MQTHWQTIGKYTPEKGQRTRLPESTSDTAVNSFFWIHIFIIWGTYICILYLSTSQLLLQTHRIHQKRNMIWKIVNDSEVWRSLKKDKICLWHSPINNFQILNFTFDQLQYGVWRYDLPHFFFLFICLPVGGWHWEITIVMDITQFSPSFTSSSSSYVLRIVSVISQL